MIKGLAHSVTGLALSTLVTTTNLLPVLAQTTIDSGGVAQGDLANPLAPTSPLAPTVPSISSTSAQSSDAYSLGAGDIIRVDSFDTPELILEARYTLLLDGSVNLPWVGAVNLQGLTLRQAAEELKQRYGNYINNPTITVTLVAARPLRIGVIGEVNRPGSYTLTVFGSESTGSSLSQRSVAETGTQWPTVSKAIQTAGGITQIANIRNITIKRPQILANRQEVQSIEVNLWQFLKDGDLSQDVFLKDGDTIVIPEAKTLEPIEANQIALSNFSPEVIRVNVVGEVVSPGSVAIRPNSTMNQAILAAGGLKNGRAKRKVEVIRLNPNGSVSRREISVDLSQGLDETNNPPVRNNDVIVVNRTGFAAATDTLSSVLNPITGLFSLLSIFGLR